jgi:Calx-beta domain-containing protein
MAGCESRQTIPGMNKLFLDPTIHFLLFLVLSCVSADAQVSPKLITGPGQFTFSNNGGFYTCRGATNAVISVDFIPGDPCFCGVVDYSTQDGTAVAGQDYTPVSGRLVFNGNGRQTFTVPIHLNPLSTGQKTVTLLLRTNANDARVILTPHPDAVLYLNYPPPPPLQISPGANQTVNVSWTDDGTSLVLEKLDKVQAPNWTAVSAWPSYSNGKFTATDGRSTNLTLYRLRRSQ